MSVDFQDYKHKTPIQVRFSDIDKLNHVNNACYHNYVELGRVHYFTEILKDSVNWEEKGFILARTEMDHAKPIFLNDEVYCFTKVSELGNKSITLKNVIVKKENQQLVICASAVSILVAMNYIDNITIPLPSEWRRRIVGYEGI